jgi:hypothetical protein
MWEWSFYSIVLPLMAVPLTYFGYWVANRRMQFFRLIRDGQLCFYSTTMLAVNLSDLLKVKSSTDVGIFAAYHIFMKNSQESITTQQPPVSPPNGNTDMSDGSPQLQPATVERMVNIAAGGTIGVGVGMAVGMALAFLKNGWGGGGEELLTFMGIGLMLCGTIGIIIGAFYKVSLPNQDATEFRKEKVA